MKVLVIRLSAMGDVGMTTHALIAVGKAYPEVEFFVLSRKRFRPIFDGIPRTVFLPADEGGIEKGLFGTISLALALRRKGFDRVVDLHDVIRSKIIRKLLGLSAVNRGIIDKGRKEKRSHIRNAEREIFLPSTHNRYMDAFAKAGLNAQLHASDVLPPLGLSKDLKEKLNTTAKDFLIFAPFAAHQSKSLSLTKAREFLHSLVGLDKPVLLLGGGEEEVSKLDQLAKATTGVMNIAGKFSFQEELQLISNAGLMVAMDSGNGHLAAIYGVPVVTIWGATHPSLGFAPYNQKRDNALFPDFQKFEKVPDTVFGKKSQYGQEITQSVHVPNTVYFSKRFAKRI